MSRISGMDELKPTHSKSETGLERPVRQFLENLDIPMLLLDAELRVLAFTCFMERLFRLGPDSFGQKFGELDSQLEMESCDHELRKVMDEASPYEQELQSADGTTFYLLRATPYRSG